MGLQVTKGRLKFNLVKTPGTRGTDDVHFLFNRTGRWRWGVGEEREGEEEEAEVISEKTGPVVNRPTTGEDPTLESPRDVGPVRGTDPRLTRGIETERTEDQEVVPIWREHSSLNSSLSRRDIRVPRQWGQTEDRPESIVSWPSRREGHVDVPTTVTSLPTRGPRTQTVGSVG